MFRVILLAFLLSIISTNLLKANTGGSIGIYNGTKDTWTKIDQPSYQMEAWNFPNTISAGELVNVYIEFQEGIFIDTKNTNGKVRYKTTSGDTIIIINWYLGLKVQLFNFKNLHDTNCRNFDLGFRWHGHVDFSLYDIDGKIYTNKDNMQNWMKNIYSELSNKRLIDFCLPGSHDAGMYYDNGSIGPASECNTLTQDVSILDQLKHGTRFFDLRPVKTGSQFKTGHFGNVGWWIIKLGSVGKFGESFSDIVRDVNKFTSEPGRQELIILYLSHAADSDNLVDKEFQDMTTEQWNNLFSQLDSINYLYVLQNGEDINLTSHKMSRLLKTNRSSVIVVVESGSIPGNVIHEKYYKKGFYLSNESFKNFNLYSNSNNYDVMSSKVDTNGQIYKMIKYPSNYFLSSWTLTQSDGASGQAANCNTRSELLFYESIKDLASVANANLPSILNNVTDRIFPNIIHTDLIIDSKAAILSTIINKKITSKYSLDANAVDNSDDQYFSFEPNPVIDQLKISDSQIIDDVEIYNIIGDKILIFKPNNQDATLDLSSLNSGVYFVKMTSGYKKRTLKIIKV